MNSSTTTLRTTEGSTTTPRRLPARCAVGGVGIFTLAVVLGGFLNDGYSHRLDAMSALAAHDAHSPWVMMLGFVGLTVALRGAGVTFWATLKGKAAVAAAALILLAGAASSVVTFARLD